MTKHEEINNLSFENKVMFDMFHDQIMALQLSIAWLMGSTCPDDSREWLETQIANCEQSPNLSEIAETFKEIAETFKEIAETFKEIAETFKEIAETFKEIAGNLNELIKLKAG